MRLRTYCLLCAALQFAARAAVAAPLDPDPLDARARGSSPPTSAAEAAAAQRALAAHGGGPSLGKGPLPDPVLLDGSNQPAEKKPDYGMLGEFEMPGSDEKSDKVGGQQDDKQSGGGSKQKDDKSQQQSGGSSGSKQQQQSQSGGAQSAAAASSGGQDASSGQSGQGGSESADASQSGGGKAGKSGTSGKSGGKSDPNAKAQGLESSGLSGPDSGEAAAQADAAPPRPGEQKIGDAQMQIKTQNSSQAPNVVGAQQPVSGKDTPQQYDAKTPGGGRQSGNSGGNKGVEKGQTMPTGL